MLEEIKRDFKFDIEFVAMNTPLDAAIGQMEYLVSKTGHVLSQDEKGLLGREWSSLFPDEKDAGRKILEKMAKGVFLAALEGYQLCPIERINEKYGMTIEQNYPGAGTLFINFAKTYWTLKEVTNDMFPASSKTVVGQLFGFVEFQIASTFFPTPGPIKLPKFARRAQIKNVLSAYWSNELIDEFIGGNPYLA